MSLAFKFKFGGDEDVRVDDANEGDVPDNDNGWTVGGMTTLGIIPSVLGLDDILSALPSNIQYNTIQLQAPYDGKITLPRRELFDIRAQLMAEDSSVDEVQAGLSTEDIRPNVYEGGFKTWECSIDLANYLVSQADLPDFSLVDLNSYITGQLGAGTAIPSLLLFHQLLSSAPVPEPPRRALVLADYNPAVLNLATIPNLLLTYALTADFIPPEAGDLEITPALLSSFKAVLAERNIHIRPVAGRWGTMLAALIFPASDRPPGETLVLASETIYSPESTVAFTICLEDMMRRSEEVGERRRASWLVAAKKMYFGVGGGVDEFLAMLRDRRGDGKLVWETEEIESGVGRCILEVRRAA
ncbi:MAG: hypothetical protein Q9184_008301 [Pyrenodesmia sp. 2 TL-2023]